MKKSDDLEKQLKTKNNSFTDESVEHHPGGRSDPVQDQGRPESLPVWTLNIFSMLWSKLENPLRHDDDRTGLDVGGRSSESEHRLEQNDWVTGEWRGALQVHYRLAEWSTPGHGAWRLSAEADPVAPRERNVVLSNKPAPSDEK
ncbi:uncharacterized protein V6R79_000976 [Siganus canaliculatus]